MDEIDIVLGYIKVQIQENFECIVELKKAFKSNPTFANFLNLVNLMKKISTELILPKVTLNKAIKFQLIDDTGNVIHEHHIKLFNDKIHSSLDNISEVKLFKVFEKFIKGYFFINYIKYVISHF